MNCSGDAAGTGGRVRLWRATKADDPKLGRGTCWTNDIDHARRYLQMPGFGGPALYVAEVDVVANEILDCRGNTAADIAAGIDAFDFDGRDLADNMLIHEELIRLAVGCAERQQTHYRWVRWTYNEPAGGEAWLYLGHEPLNAIPQT